MTLDGSNASVSNKVQTRKRVRTALKKHRNTLEILVRKVKVKPYDYFTYPLGLFDKQAAPKGFCIGIKPDTVESEAITVNTRMRPVHDKIEYSLIIANKGKKSFYAEISKL